MGKRIVKTAKNIAVKIAGAITKRIDAHRLANPDAIKPTDATNATGATSMRRGRFSGMGAQQYQNHVFACVAMGDRVTDQMIADVFTAEFPTSAVVVGTGKNNPVAGAFPVAYIPNMRRKYNTGRHGNPVPTTPSPRCVTDIKTGNVIVDPKWSHKTDAK